MFRGVALASVLLFWSPALPAADVHPISANFTDPAQYAYLYDLLPNDIQVVSLAESIHMTREFPMVRIGMLKYLNEKVGFGLLAFEGSPVDLWATQDEFLATVSRDDLGNLSTAPATPDAIAQANAGLFGVWNTQEMRIPFEYERSTWNTDHPLYITAYDIQPGLGRGTQGQAAFEMFYQRLLRYAPAPPGFDQSKWATTMGPLAQGCSGDVSSHAAEIENSIATLEKWIDAAAPEVDDTYPFVPHGAVLRLIPASLRASLSLCQTVGPGPRDWQLYKTTRDKLASQFAIALKDSSAGNKLMLWAHTSHLFYDADKSSTSVGELLHEALGPRLYTIAGFALGGGTLVLFSDVNDDIGYTFVGRGGAADIVSHLDVSCVPACFLDMRRTANPYLLEPHPVWWEWGPRPLALAKNFDAIFLVAQVHPPDVPRIYWLLSLDHYKWQLGGIAGFILLGVTVGMIRRISRRGRMMA